jgi:glycerophosphoryl diester phosphodiesterase
MRQWLQQAGMRTADALTAAIPRAAPPDSVLQKCKIIAHRGEHDNDRVIENTLPAFARARANGVWGIECDIRWTADLVPVICHDPSGERLFRNSRPLCELQFEEVRAQMPLIPSLAELIAEFGKNTHLMLEIKNEYLPAPARQQDILRDHLAELEPGQDYHILALEAALLSRVNFVPPRYCYLVAELDVDRLSRQCLELACGGLTGHYLLLGNTVCDRHRRAGQGIGTGFIASRSCLYRELNRGVDWIFSNDAVKLQKICDEAL